MATSSNIKLSNVIGAPFQDYVLQQLYKRAGHNSSESRTLDEVLYLANKTAWVRLASSVNVIDKRVRINNVDKDLLMKDTYTQLGVSGYKERDSLAKNWILQAGTSKQATSGNAIELRYGISASNAEGFSNVEGYENFENTVNASYGLGGTQELGYVPMPGLTSVVVETLGRLGSLRQATINFRVNNLNQLNVIEALYFRLGYSMILEFGHTQYYTNKNNKFIVNGIYGVGDPFNDNLRKEELIQQINTKTREADGNYGGMLGIVISFNWSATQDGGYDCTVKLIGHGAIMDSLKANQSYTLPPGTIKEYKKAEELIADFQARELERLNAIENNTGTGGTDTVPVFTPATDIEDLYVKIRDILHDGDTTWTFNDFVHKYAYPIPYGATTFLGAEYQTGIPPGTFQLDAGLGWSAYDFGVAISLDDVADPYVKIGLGNAYGGLFLNTHKGSQVKFIHVPQGGAGTTCDLDVTDLDFNFLSNAATRDFTYVGPDKSPYTFNDTYGTIGTILDQKHLEDDSFSSNLVYMVQNLFSRPTTKVTALGQSDYTKGPKNLGDTIAPSTSTLQPISPINILDGGARAPVLNQAQYGPASEPSYVSSDLYGKVGGYTLDITVSYPSSEYANYAPTGVQVADAIESYLSSTKVVPLTNVQFSYGVGFDKVGTYAFTQRVYIEGQFTLPVKKVRYSGIEGQGKITGTQKGYPIITTIDNKVTSEAPEVPVTFTIKTNYLGAFSNFAIDGTAVDVTPTTVDETEEEGGGEVNKSDTTQYVSPEGFSSALQAMLTIVQTESQAAALEASGVVVHDITPSTLKFYEDGALKGTIVPEPANQTYKTADPDLEAVQKKKFNLLNYAIKGFNASLMADPDLYETIPSVDFYKMCTSYVFKYKMTGIEGVAGSVRSPTYISFGYLLAFINNMCLIYDSNYSRELGNANTPGTNKRPYIYIDFNPETNFCYTSPQQFSIDPTVCMIPINATSDQYAELFPEGKGGQIVTNLLPPLLDPASEDIIANNINLNFPYKSQDEYDKEGGYRGGMMNILLNCQYLLDLCANMSRNDPEQSVNLKPFLDQILIDVNKALGGVNLFRASYVDESNVVQIVDDQWVPSPTGENVKQGTVLNTKILETNKANDQQTSGQLPGSTGAVISSVEAPGQLAVVGTKSLTREFRFNTTISSKLAATIAISAQASVGAVNSKDHSSYSHLNLFFEDRYSRSKEDPSKGAPTQSTGDSEDRSTDQQAADLFNDHVTAVYSKFDKYSPKNIQAAKNYYLERMSKVKAVDPLASASPYISLELEMTMDGISGMMMGNAFTVPNDRLPYTYRGLNNTTKIAFIVTGLTHTIQNNEWLTRIKGQMIKLKDPVAIATAATQIQSVKSSLSATITGALRDCPGGFGCRRGYGDAYKSADLYKNQAFRDGVDKINEDFGIADKEILYKIMYAESKLQADSITPSATTGKPFAYGLLQWTEDNVGSIVPSLDEVNRTDGVGQLKWVRKYLKYWQYLVKSWDIYSLYGITFFPRMLPHLDEPNWVIESPNLTAYEVSYGNPAIACQAGKLPGTPLTVSDFKKYADCINK